VEELYDGVGITHYKNLIRTQQAAIRYYVKNTDGLVRQYDRERHIDTPHINKANQRVLREKIDPQKSDYEALKDELGASGLPETLDSYRQTIYNKHESKILHAYIMSRQRGTVEPVVRYKDYVQRMAEINEKVIGMQASNGLIITGFSDHMIERTFGVRQDASHNNAKRVGVSVDEIKSILQKGEVSPSRNDTFKYKNKNAYVVVNSRGELVTVVPRRRN